MKAKIIRRWALYLFFFTINFEVWDPFSTGGHFSISKLAGAIYFLSILPIMSQFIRTIHIQKILIPIWLFFIFLTGVSFVHVNYMDASFFNFSIFQNIIIFWFLINHERFDQGILEKGFLSFAMGSFVMAILFYLGIGVEYEGLRVSIFGDNQNNIGTRLSVSIIVLLVAAFQNNLKINKWRFLFLLFIPLMIVLMAETGSRLAFFSLVLAFVGGVFLYKTRSIASKVVVFLIAIGLGFYFWEFLSQSSVLLERLRSSTEEGDLGGRAYIWSQVIPLIKDNLIFGVGETGYKKFTMGVFGHYRSPHNVIFEVLALSGIIGLVIYLISLGRIVFEAYRYYRKSGILLQLLLFAPIVGMMLSGHLLTVKLGYIIYALAASRIFYYNPRIEQKKFNL